MVSRRFGLGRPNCSPAPPRTKVRHRQLLYRRLRQEEHPDRRVDEPRERLKLFEGGLDLSRGPFLKLGEPLGEFIARATGAFERPIEQRGSYFDADRHGGSLRL